MNDRIDRILKMLESQPNDLFLNHALALEWIKQGDDDKAQVAFELNLKNEKQYVATYYHLAKLLERKQLKENAIAIYEQGMQVAKIINDQHAYNELQGAYEDLLDY